jgi:putative transposase
MDEHTRDCVKIRVEQAMKGSDVQESLEGLFAERGAPKAIRGDNGCEFKNRRLRQWLKGMGAEALYVDPGSRGARRRTGSWRA